MDCSTPGSSVLHYLCHEFSSTTVWTTWLEIMHVPYWEEGLWLALESLVCDMGSAIWHMLKSHLWNWSELVLFLKRALRSWSISSQPTSVHSIFPKLIPSTGDASLPCPQCLPNTQADELFPLHSRESMFDRTGRHESTQWIKPLLSVRGRLTPNSIRSTHLMVNYNPGNVFIINTNNSLPFRVR